MTDDMIPEQASDCGLIRYRMTAEESTQFRKFVDGLIEVLEGNGD